MTVSELIDRLREFDAHSEVYLYLDRRRFAPPVWAGILDIAGLFSWVKSDWYHKIWLRGRISLRPTQSIVGMVMGRNERVVYANPSNSN